MNARQRIPVYCIDQPNGHPPLALGMITAFAKAYKGGILNDTYVFIPELVSSSQAMHALVQKHGPGILLCSNYIWNSAHILEISRLAKAFFPSSITVHGGPSVPKYDYSCAEYFSDHPHVDIAARGEGEVTTAELLEQLAIHAEDYARGDRSFLSDVCGITFRSGRDGRPGELVRTPDRPVVKDVDALPSPYLTGEFHEDDAPNWRAAIVETNRGCPYGCTFCDWGSATLSKIRRFSMERVSREIEWLARNNVEILWIADANFGIFDRDVEIAGIIADCRKKHGFPRQIVVNYAKNATVRLSRIVEILHRAGITVDGIISIQTRDPQTLSIIQRSNISTDRYEELIEIFKQHELPISTDLMIGLPGSTVESFRADLQFFFDRGIVVKCYPTVLLPNSPMAHRDYREKFRVEVNSSNRVVATCSYTRSDMRIMKRLARAYEVAVEASVLKYLLVYLQMDHGIKAVDVLADLCEEIYPETTPFPEAARLFRGYPSLLSDRNSDDWDAFYAEIGGFVTGRFGIDERQLKTVLAIQNGIMPAKGRALPETLRLDHDFGAYFAVVRGVRNIETLKASMPMRLAGYGPGTFEISDPHDLCGENSNRIEVAYDSHRIEWELSSPLNALVQAAD